MGCCLEHVGAGAPLLKPNPPGTPHHARRTFFRSTFAQLQAGLFTANPAAFPPAVFTLPNFVWAVAAVRSRSHPPLEGDKIALAPLVDLVRGLVGFC